MLFPSLTLFIFLAQKDPIAILDWFVLRTTVLSTYDLSIRTSFSYYVSVLLLVLNHFANFSSSLDLTVYFVVFLLSVLLGV